MKSRIEKLQYYFRHFSSRLSERYNIFITFDEYLILCNKPSIKDEIVVQNKNGYNSYHGFIHIQGKKIKVCRQISRPRALLTALPLNKKTKQK